MHILPKRSLARLGLVLAVLLLADQACLFIFLKDGQFMGRRIAPFDPPLFHPAQWQAIQRLESVQGELGFDALLGWCPSPSTDFQGYSYDWAGARFGTAPLPRERAEGSRRVVLVGCSFTRGDEVSPTEAWGARLSDLTGTEVANLGVGGFGPGQALLRYRRDGAPLQPDEVWYGLVPGRLPRAITVYWPAMGHQKQAVSFKPRFRLDESGTLELCPNPARDKGHLVELVMDQRAFLNAVGETDAWVARVPLAYAPAGSSWTHHLGLGRVLLTYLESGDRSAREQLEAADGELGPLAVALGVQFAKEVTEAGAIPRVVILPDRDDLVSRVAEGKGYWDGISHALADAGVDVRDLSEQLIAAGATGDPALWKPGGHYGPELNAAVAEALAGAAR